MALIFVQASQRAVYVENKRQMKCVFQLVGIGFARSVLDKLFLAKMTKTTS